MIKRIAVIDMGSNSVRLQISEIEGKKFKIILEEKDNIRLGEDAFEKGVFTRETIQRTVDTLKRYRQIIDNQDITHVRAVATAGFREVSNQYEVQALIFQETGIKIEIISGAEEARLIFLGVISNYDLQNKRVMVVDIGGGSCELIIGNSLTIEDMKSLRLGCIRMTRHFLKTNPVQKEDLVLFHQELESVFSKIRESMKKHPFDLMIGTGGSLNNIAEILARLSKEPEKKKSRPALLKELQALNQELISRTYSERLLLPGLEERRADILLASGLLMQRILELFQKTEFITLNKGLKDGLTLDTLSKLGIPLPFQEDLQRIKENRLWEIGHKYSFDEKHAKTVTGIAMKLFDALCVPLKLKGEWRDYLKAASILHDVGYHISYSKHHKHSQYLIENSEIIGFDENEIQIISNLARYHRKSLPKISHKKYKDLSIVDKNIVLQMGSILRIADAMDRSHNALFEDFEVFVFENELRMIVNAREDDFSLEREGISKKSDLFEATFNKKVNLETRR